MADTIITTPSQDNGAAGWAVAVITLLAVIVGGVVWYRYHGAEAAPAQSPSTNINVSIPTPTSGGTQSGNTSGGTSNQ